MIEALMLWNEPNNLSHWDFQLDKEWKIYARMLRESAAVVRRCAPQLRIVLGGISPVDASFIRLLESHGALEEIDVVAIHGFPLDWNHWNIHQWPLQVETIEQACRCPVWVTEAGCSSFGAEEVQVFGLETTTRLLLHRVERVFWYSLLDLPPTWAATTRHRESEGSAYYRHYYMGLIRADGTPKPSFFRFSGELGLCQWFHFQDHRLQQAIAWMRQLGVRKLRTGLSWADWYRPGAEAWFDYQMSMLAEFDLTLTLCYTPAHLGLEPQHNSPPVNTEEFARFARWVTERYCQPHSLPAKAAADADLQPV